MNKFERIMLAATFVLALVASVYALGWNMVLKPALPDLDHRIADLNAGVTDLRIFSMETVNEFEQTRTAIKELRKRCKDCGKCCSCPKDCGKHECCSKESAKCDCCRGCSCKKDGCMCAKGVGKCGAYACRCGYKKACDSSKPVPRFCRFTFIQIHDGTAWFGWLDADGAEHETRMTLEEFERWGDDQDHD